MSPAPPLCPLLRLCSWIFVILSQQISGGVKQVLPAELTGMCEGWVAEARWEAVTAQACSARTQVLSVERGALQTGLRKEMALTVTPTITLGKCDRPQDRDRAFHVNAAIMATCHNVPQVQGPLSVLTFPLCSLSLTSKEFKTNLESHPPM